MHAVFWEEATLNASTSSPWPVTVTADQPLLVTLVRNGTGVANGGCSVCVCGVTKGGEGTAGPVQGHSTDTNACPRCAPFQSSVNIVKAWLCPRPLLVSPPPRPLAVCLMGGGMASLLTHTLHP